MVFPNPRLPLEVLLSVGRLDPGRMEQAHCTEPACSHEHAGHDHSETFSMWSYETDQPLSLDALRETARKLPGTIYRAKGVIYSSDAPERRAVLQVVGKRVELSLQDDDWGGRAPLTQIVVIGAAERIDGALLREQFQKVVVPHQAL